MNRRLKILVSVCIMLTISPVATIACPPDCGDCEYFDQYTQQCVYECEGCCSCFNDSCENVDYYCDACEYCTSCGCECAVFANLISGISGTYAIGDSTTVSASTSGSLPPGCSIDWSGDASFEDISGTSATAVFNTAGTGLQITAATSCQARPVPSAQFDVIDVAITTPSSYPVYIEFGGSVQLDCTPEGPTSGSYSWSGSGPGTVTFSPSANIKNPTFSASQSGSYTVSVNYSLGGATASDTSGTIKVVSVTSVVATADYASVGQSVTFGALTNPLNSGPYVTITWSGGGTPATGSGSQFVTSWSSPGPKTVIATCGTSNAQKGVTVVEIDRLQYNDPDTGYTDISGTLYVYQGTTVTFKAIPDPCSASWPSGKPVWSGSSGASGTGTTKAVTFNTLSTSTSDYKTVTAECGNTVTANVIVFEFDGVLTPDDGFIGRSFDDYGVEETVGLSHTTNPTGITGLPLEWEIHSGVGSVIVEESKYDAGAIPGDVDLKLELKSGPSKGHYKSYNKTIHAPTYRFARSRFETGIYHIYRQHGIKFKGEYFVDPKNVSFTNIELREGTSTPAVGTGYFEPVNGDVHTPGSWLAPAYPNTTYGCWWAGDTTGFEGSGSDYIGQSGTFTNYYIDIEYRGDDSEERGIGTIESLMTVDTDGYSLIKKGSVGWVTVFFSAPTTNPTW